MKMVSHCLFSLRICGERGGFEPYFSDAFEIIEWFGTVLAAVQCFAGSRAKFADAFGLFAAALGAVHNCTG
jgi:hypothetical protein